LAHVINFATQALIKAYTKAKHFSPEKPDEHIPDVDALERDEVGLIRAIAVKVSVQGSIIHAMDSHIDLGTIICKLEEAFKKIQSDKLQDLENDKQDGVGLPQSSLVWFFLEFCEP
jgi:hypothetical protein